MYFRGEEFKRIVVRKAIDMYEYEKISDEPPRKKHKNWIKNQEL